MTRRGLGRGLDALISSTDPAAAGRGGTEGAREVDIDCIAPNPRQPRQSMDDDRLAELAASIRAHGLIQPLVVTEGPSAGSWTIIAGERRWRAARMAGLRAVPVVVRTATEREMLALALIENVQRTDLNAIEAAEAYRQLMDGFGLSQAEVADLIGKSRVAVANTVRLLGLDAELRSLVADGSLSEGHGRALLALADGAARRRLARQALEGGWPVRRLESEVRALAAAPRAAPSPAPPASAPGAPAGAPPAADADTRFAERVLEEALGTRVQIRRSGDGGRVVVHFYSEEDLAALFDKLTGGAS